MSLARHGHLRVVGYPWLAYLPQFAAESLGYYHEEGLHVSFLTQTGAWEGLLDTMAKEQADIAIGNIWLALRPVEESRRLIPFAHSSQHPRFLLLKRAPRGEFDWDDLRGQTVVFGNDIPTSWVAFRHSLRQRGLTLDEVGVLVGFSPKQALAEFAAGLGNYIVMDVERAYLEGLSEVAALADSLGPVPWSVFCASGPALMSLSEELRAFRRAIGRALSWISDHDSRDIADAVTDRFADFDSSARLGIIGRYKALQLWAPNSDIPPGQVERWQQILVESGLIRQTTPVSQLLAF